MSIHTAEQAIKVLDRFEFYSDGGVQVAPAANEFHEALVFLKDLLGIKEPAAIQFGPRFAIMTKERRHQGHVFAAQPTGLFAEIGEDVIRLTGDCWGKSVDITFKVGDTVEYDSYNLRYLGVIVKITPKAVTIRPQYSTSVKRLDLYGFAWRNHNFDLEQALTENAETRNYI